MIANKKEPCNNYSVLITGGSGMVGRYLTSFLLEKGYTVSHLSRVANLFGRVRVFRWDPEKEILDPSALENTDYIIHLAGANIGEKRWTEKRREEIIRSRVDSANLLLNTVIINRFPLKAFISASATGYYGSITSETIFTEEMGPGEDFTGIVCQKWEEAAEKFAKSGIRTVKLRTAVVLEKNCAVLKKLQLTEPFGILPVPGSGKQYFPWIHISDLCKIYIKAVEDSQMNGAFNACAPEQIAFIDFVKKYAELKGKKKIITGVPAVLLKIAFGKMSEIILQGSRVSSSKLISAGFTFDFPTMDKALKNILGS